MIKVSIFNKIDVLIVDAFNNVFQRRTWTAASTHQFQHSSPHSQQDQNFQMPLAFQGHFKVTSFHISTLHDMLYKSSSISVGYARYSAVWLCRCEQKSKMMHRTPQFCWDVDAFWHDFGSNQSLCQVTCAPLQLFYCNSPLWSMTNRPLTSVDSSMGLCS